MTSTFAWLDYSARERRAMLEVVDLFREKGTVDELGLGVIRDAFADHFFPGTSTLHSRARYWLLIPWVYRRLEAERTPSAKADERARRLQADLVRALVTGGEGEGVIGIEARDKVLRPPAVVYWAGLYRHGIRLVPGSIGRYHASLDGFYASAGPRRSEGDDSELVDVGRRNWDAGLPGPPTDLFERADFRMRREDAEYLRERMITSSPESFLAWGLRRPSRFAKVDAPWMHPDLAAAPNALRVPVELARRFSLLMFGAVLAYNVLMAEASAAAGLRDDSLVTEYRAAYAGWAAGRIVTELDALRRWDRGELWSFVERLAPGRISRTRRFVEQWIARVLDSPASAIDDPAMRTLIADRERVMKGSLARLHNHRALERWNGRSGVFELTYRWNEGRTIIRDVADGLASTDVGSQ